MSSWYASDYLTSILLSMEAVAWGSVLLFGLAAILMGAFDISLPRGDVIGMSGAIDATALVLLGPLAAIASCLMGIGGAFLFRRGVSRPVRLAVTLSARLGGLLAAILVLSAFNSLSLTNDRLGVTASFAAVLTYLVVDVFVVLILSSRRTSRPLIRLVQGNVTMQTPFVMAQISAAMLTVLTYSKMGDWSLFVLLALLLLIRQSYAMLLEIRETFRTTVEVLVEAAEGLVEAQRGHAERTAQIAREIAVRCGLTPREVERVSYAALLHDIGYLGDSESPLSTPRESSSVLQDISIFEDLIGVLSLHDGRGPSGARVDDRDRLAAYIVALASDIDAARTGVRTSDPRFGGARRLSTTVSAGLRARAVSAAVHLGYGLPALP